MGNHQGKHKAKQEETIDYGTYTPFGIYQLSNLDYDQKIIKKLILERKIAPFYKGLNEPDEVIKLPSPLLNKLYQQQRPKSSSQLSLPSSGGGNNKWGNLTGHQKSQSQKSPKIDTSLANAQESILTGLYKKSIECPICFLYYPSNINYSSCCDEPICTECLVEIKRAANSETPPLCPFCAHENFAVRYDHLENPFLANPSNPEILDNDEKPQKHKTASSITADEFRPENMRNSSNRSSQRGAILGHPGRFLSIRPRSSRRNRGDLPSDYAGYLAAVHNMGVDIEELMIMEAIRASLLEAEQNGYSTENTPTSQPAEAADAPNDEEAASPQESQQETLPSPSEAADDTIQSDTTSIQTGPINSPTTSPATTDLDDKRPITNSELIAQEDSTRIA